MACLRWRAGAHLPDFGVGQQGAEIPACRSGGFHWQLSSRFRRGIIADADDGAVAVFFPELRRGGKHVSPIAEGLP